MGFFLVFALNLIYFPHFISAIFPLWMNDHALTSYKFGILNNICRASFFFCFGRSNVFLRNFRPVLFLRMEYFGD